MVTPKKGSHRLSASLYSGANEAFLKRELRMAKWDKAWVRLCEGADRYRLGKELGLHSGSDSKLEKMRKAIKELDFNYSGKEVREMGWRKGLKLAEEISSSSPGREESYS